MSATAERAALPFERAARLHGAYRWFEQRLFALTGSAASVPSDAVDPALRVHLAEASLRHAWHAALFADRLPVVAHLDPDALTVPTAPFAAAASALDALLADAEPADRPGLVVAALADPLLERLVATYAAHRAATVGVSDAPTARALDLVIADLAADLAAARALAGPSGGSGATAGPGAELGAALEAAGAVEGYLCDGDLSPLEASEGARGAP